MKVETSLGDGFKQRWKEGLLIGVICGLPSPSALLFSPSPLPSEVPAVELLTISVVINSSLLSGASALLGVDLSPQAKTSGAPILHDLTRRSVGDAKQKKYGHR